MTGQPHMADLRAQAKQTDDLALSKYLHGTMLHRYQLSNKIRPRACSMPYLTLPRLAPHTPGRLPGPAPRAAEQPSRRGGAPGPAGAPPRAATRACRAGARAAPAPAFPPPGAPAERNYFGRLHMRACWSLRKGHVAGTTSCMPPTCGVVGVLHQRIGRSSALADLPPGAPAPRHASDAEPLLQL